MDLEFLIPDYVSEDVKSSIMMWENFMTKRVVFSEFGSEIHTKKHCGRVLLFAELISDKIDLDDSSRDALAMASIFHDSRRNADGPDIGHGKRAADYYREFCESGVGMLPLPFDMRTYFAMAYHDRDDSMGIREITDYYKDSQERDNAILIYNIFKDSDALDRWRLGLRDGLDLSYLRTDEARSMSDFSKDVVIKSTDGTAPKDLAELRRRFMEKHHI